MFSNDHEIKNGQDKLLTTKLFKTINLQYFYKETLLYLYTRHEALHIFH